MCCVLAHALVFQVGEYCEVFNDSKTDPAAWVARIQKVGRGNYTVSANIKHNSAHCWLGSLGGEGKGGYD